MNILFSFIILVSFSYFILAADKFFVENKQGWVKAAFLQIQEDTADWYISLDNIILSNELSDKFTYIVQPWDNLSIIASKFWTTVDTIKKVNWIKKDSLKVWEKITITEEEWLIYEIPQNIKLSAFAAKYKLDIAKLQELNYISEQDYEFEKWDELFIPVTKSQAQQLGLIIVPTVNKPIVNNSNKSERPTWKNNSGWNKWTNKQQVAPVFEPSYTWRWSDVVSKWYFNPGVQNGFVRWHCTRYVAIKKFPYVNKSKQSRIWWWNAKDWYRNAKEAGYSVWKNAKKWSIIVLRYWWSRYYNAWHVWIVADIDWTWKRVLIDEMNAVWRFVVSKRRIPMDWKIIWYIYY